VGSVSDGGSAVRCSVASSVASSTATASTGLSLKVARGKSMRSWSRCLALGALPIYRTKARIWALVADHVLPRPRDEQGQAPQKCHRVKVEMRRAVGPGPAEHMAIARNCIKLVPLLLQSGADLLVTLHRDHLVHSS